VSPPLAGVRTWAEVVDVADGPQAFAAALRAQAGTRTRPHAEVRRWALAQTARAQNAPLRRRLQEVGIDAGP